ncbi:unnamed protein product [Amaranthus hypochondriacus]
MQVPAEEDSGVQIAPIARLEEVAVTTGEEDEDALLDFGKVRLVMRQSKTLKICANHLIIAGMTVQEHAGNEKSCVWHASE